MRDEVTSYAEARGVSVDRKTKTKNPDDMEIGSYQEGKKGKGKGKDCKSGKGGKGGADKGQVVCWECGKKGNYGRDCYSKTKKGDAIGGNGTGAGATGKGKGNKSKAGGKAAAGALALGDAPDTAQVDAGTFDLGSYAAAASAAPADWICVNIDSGAGATVCGRRLRTTARRSPRRDG